MLNCVILVQVVVHIEYILIIFMLYILQIPVVIVTILFLISHTLPKDFASRVCYPCDNHHSSRGITCAFIE